MDNSDDDDNYRRLSVLIILGDWWYLLLHRFASLDHNLNFTTRWVNASQHQLRLHQNIYRHLSGNYSYSLPCAGKASQIHFNT